MSAKKYSASVNYEKKLKDVMARLGVSDFNYDWNRTECFIEFHYNGQLYRFEHSLDKAKAAGQKIQWVSDLFAQLVLTLEDIARMSERGIYSLQTWIEGMKALPVSSSVGKCFLVLGFDSVPKLEDLKKRYKKLAKISHPDTGGNPAQFNIYKTAYEDALKELEDE